MKSVFKHFFAISKFFSTRDWLIWVFVVIDGVFDFIVVAFVGIVVSDPTQVEGWMSYLEAFGLTLDYLSIAILLVLVRLFVRNVSLFFQSALVTNFEVRLHHLIFEGYVEKLRMGLKFNVFTRLQYDVPRVATFVSDCLALTVDLILVVCAIAFVVAKFDLVVLLWLCFGFILVLSALLQLSKWLRSTSTQLQALEEQRVEGYLELTEAGDQLLVIPFSGISEKLFDFVLRSRAKLQVVQSVLVGAPRVSFDNFMFLGLLVYLINADADRDVVVVFAVVMLRLGPAVFRILSGFSSLARYEPSLSVIVEECSTVKFRSTRKIS